MKNIAIKTSLFLNYFVFAVLLNSVGTVILQVQSNFDISKADASVLEGFKDLPIAITSFIAASFLPRLGLKNAMLIGLAAVAVICSVVPMADDFWYFKLLFLVIGVSFALIKVSAFATIGLITETNREHSSFMNMLEAIFMAGILIGNFLISYFVDDFNPKSLDWLYVYWMLSGLTILAFLLLFFTKLDEKASVAGNKKLLESFKDMLALVVKPLIVVFIIAVFLYVLIEQSFQTWFPTFYKDILSAPSSMAIQAGAVLAGATFLGRLVSSYVLLKIKWIYFLSACLIIVATIILLALPLAKSASLDLEAISWFKAPVVVYLLPIMGLFLAPIYPTINSRILSSLPKPLHSSMSGLIVVFSALGGTTGSIITGNIFDKFDGTTAFYFALIPISLIFVALWILYKMTKNYEEH